MSDRVVTPNGTAGRWAVLHVLGGAQRGGSELWFLEVTKYIDRQRFRIDLLVHRSGGPLTGRLAAAGVRVFCIDRTNPIGYMVRLLRLFRREGPYSAVHSHLHLYSGLVLRAARLAGVPCRIAHARNTSDGRRPTWWRVLYRTLMRRWLRADATHLLAVSSDAARGAFGPEVVTRRGCTILTGIDVAPYRDLPEPSAARVHLSIAPDALLVGHVGSFRRQKNHEFLLRVFRELLVLRKNAMLVLVGDGALRPQIQSVVAAEGLRANVRFLGERDDLPIVYRAMDCFVFPSLYEGLPRVLLEAQAAGVPCLASDTVSREAMLRPGSVRFLSLAEGPAAWAGAVDNMLLFGRPSEAQRNANLQSLSERGLTSQANACILEALYEQVVR